MAAFLREPAVDESFASERPDVVAQMRSEMNYGPSFHLLCQRVAETQGIEPLLVKSTVAAGLLGLHPNTLRKLAGEGKIPHVVIQHDKLYPVAELRKWIGEIQRGPRRRHRKKERTQWP